MEDEFLRPVFDGARFAEHTLPLEVGRDLAAYEALVVELAKHLYMRENPSRRRLPKGFGADFHLHLRNVEHGSAIPVLTVFEPTRLGLGEGSNPLFERARDLVAECVASPLNNLPNEFPRELLAYFNQLGRSLREGESLRLGPDAVLTPQSRKHLVLAVSNVYEREIELFGVIEQVDWKSYSFRLRMLDGGQTIVPMPENFYAKAGEYGGRKRVGVTVKGVGNYSSSDRLQKVVAVKSLDIQLNYQLAAKFDALASIENGWFDGSGLGPDKNQLGFVAEMFSDNYPETLDLPTIVPTQEGNLLFEWDALGSPSVDLELSSLVAEFHAFDLDGGDIEQGFLLTTKNDWERFFDFMNKHVEPTAE